MVLKTWICLLTFQRVAVLVYTLELIGRYVIDFSASSGGNRSISSRAPWELVVWKVQNQAL